jgi:hypothetical protein
MIKWGNCWNLQRPHGLKETLTPDQPPTFPILPWGVWSTTNSLLAFKTLYMEDVCFQVSYNSKDKFKTWRESGKKKRHCLFLASLFFKFSIPEWRSLLSVNSGVVLLLICSHDVSKHPTLCEAVATPILHIYPI